MFSPVVPRDSPLPKTRQSVSSTFAAQSPTGSPETHSDLLLETQSRFTAGGKEGQGTTATTLPPTPPPAGLPPCHDHNSLATHARPPVGWPTRPAPLQITPHTPGLVPADPASSAEVPFWGRVIWWCPPREAQPLPPYGGSLCSPGAAAGRPGAACLPLVQPLRTLGPARPVLAGHCCGCVIRCAGLVG
jgi:hypothetical protein